MKNILFKLINIWVKLSRIKLSVELIRVNLNKIELCKIK